MSNTWEMLFSQCLVRSCRRRVPACARACLCVVQKKVATFARERVRVSMCVMVVVVVSSLFGFLGISLALKKRKKCRKSSRGDGVNARARRGVTAEGSVFGVGEWGRKRHDFQMFTLSLQVVAFIAAIICGCLCKGACWHLARPCRKASGE